MTAVDSIQTTENVIKRYSTALNDAQDKHIEAVECLEEIKLMTDKIIEGEWMPEVLYIHEVNKVLNRYFNNEEC